MSLLQYAFSPQGAALSSAQALYQWRGCDLLQALLPQGKIDGLLVPIVFNTILELRCDAFWYLSSPWHFDWLCFSFVWLRQSSCGFYRFAQSVSESSRLWPLASLSSALADVHPARQYIPRIERCLDLSADSSPGWLVPLLLLLLIRHDRWLYLLSNYCGATNRPSAPRCMCWKHWLYRSPGRKLTSH